MTGAPSSFPFFKLPAELRRHILVQTDLVTPCRRARYGGGKFLTLYGPTEDTPRERYTPSDESEENVHVNTALQTADSGESRDPNWSSPAALFLVSKAFSALAQSVLLSENHIEAYGGLQKEDFEPLWDIDGGPAWEEALHRDAAISQAALFISSAVRCEVLESLRSLDIAFPTPYGKCTKPPAAVLQWQKAMQRFGKTLNPRRLIMHIHGDRTIPVLETAFGTHPTDFRHEKLERSDLLDLVRQSVETYWPLDQLQRLDGVRMFLWYVDRSFEGDKLVYYCRHHSEELPRLGGDLDLFELRPWPIFHTQRECQTRDGSAVSTVHDEQEARQPASWVEGVFVRPGDEDEIWCKYREEMEALK